MTDYESIDTVIPHDIRTGEIRPMSFNVAKRIAVMSFIPAVVGLTMLGLFRLTAVDWFVNAGILAAVPLGLMSLVIGLIAIMAMIRASTSRPRQKVVASHYLTAIIGTTLSVVAAVFCFVIAPGWILSPHVPLAVKNETQVTIDRVVIHFDSGDIAAGPIVPGQTKSLGRQWLRHRDGPLDVTVVVNDTAKRHTEWNSPDLCYEKMPDKRRPMTLVIEPTELPRAPSH